MHTKKISPKIWGTHPQKYSPVPFQVRTLKKKIGLKGGHLYKPAQDAHISWAGTDEGVGVVPDKTKGTTRSLAEEIKVRID
jgi:hypothetical protein